MNPEIKISPRQLVLTGIMLTLSPVIQTFPGAAAEFSGKAAVLTPIITAAGILVLILIFRGIFAGEKYQNLSAALRGIFGRPAAFVLLWAYCLWAVILAAWQLQLFVSIFTASVMPQMSPLFITAVMAVLMGMSASRGHSVTVRAVECFCVVTLILVPVVYAFSISEIKFGNLMLIPTKDILSAFAGSGKLIPMAALFVPMFLFFEKVEGKEKLWRHSVWGVAIFALFGMVTMIVTIGVLGVSFTSEASFPFYTVAKNISVFGTIERIEALLIPLLIIGAVTVGAVQILSAQSAFKVLLPKTEGFKWMTIVITSAAAAISLPMSYQKMPLERHLETIVMWGGTVLFVAVPVLLFAVKKIRKL